MLVESINVDGLEREGRGREIHGQASGVGQVQEKEDLT